MFKHIRERFSIMRAVLLGGAAAVLLAACAGDPADDMAIPDKPYPNLADVPPAPRLELAPGQAQTDLAALNADRTAAMDADRRLRGGDALAAAGVAAPPSRPGAGAPSGARPAPAARPSAPAGQLAHAERLGTVTPPGADGDWAPADRLKLVAMADAARGRPGRVRVVPLPGPSAPNRGAAGVAETLIALGVPANRVAPPPAGPAASVEIYLDY